jgi:hypothetical protein
MLLAALSPGKCLVVGFRALINGGGGVIKNGIKNGIKTLIKNNQKDSAMECEDALGITGFGVLPISRETPSGEGGQDRSGRASTGPGAGYDSPTTETEKGGMGEGYFGIKDLKSFVSKTSQATDHDSQTIENSEREFGMRNRVREGECKLEKRNCTEDESGMKNRKVTWESKGEFRKRNVGTVRHSEPSWESQGEFGKRKASTTRNSEPKVGPPEFRVPFRRA